MEVLLDVMAFAGFIGLASLYRAPGERRDPAHDGSTEPPAR
jgi:hypothetical protein